MQGKFGLDDIPWIVSEARLLWSNEENPQENRLWQLLAQSPQPRLEVPQWARLEIDPFSDDYRDQVLRLWQALYDRGTSSSGSEYAIAEHEQDAAYDDCPIRFPGYLARRDPDGVRHAGFEFAMLGDLLVHSGLSAGRRALEYGAGSGNIAINLARLGVIVDTVDISKTYCEHIRLNSEYFQVSLQAHNEEFGFDPSAGTCKYDCIIFHACFHHSLDHRILVEKLAGLVADDGIILLSNEPITEEFYQAWGLRTDPESVSVIAGRGWMELGFKFSYLRELFFRNALFLSEVRPSLSGIPLFAAKKIRGLIPLTLGSPYVQLLEGVYEPEENGIWTSGEAKIPTPCTFAGRNISIDLTNYFPVPKRLQFTVEGAVREVLLDPESRVQIDLDIPECDRDDLSVHIRAELHRPSEQMPGSLDDRQLGVMLHSVTYA